MSKSQNELPQIEIASQIGLKAQKRYIKTTVPGINSLKTTQIWLFDNPGDHTWQPFLVSSQQIFVFLEPCQGVSTIYLCFIQNVKAGIRSRGSITIAQIHSQTWWSRCTTRPPCLGMNLSDGDTATTSDPCFNILYKT